MSAQIIYSVIVRGQNVVLSEYAIASGNFIQFAKTVVQKVYGTNLKKSYQYERYEFHILTEDNYAFLIMADKDFKMRIAFACLEDIKKLFFSAFPPEIRDNALAYGLNEQFSKVQKQRVDYFNSPEADKLALIKANVEATKGIMMENLDKLLQRGEKIDILVQKTQVMVNISTDMKKHATQLRKDMWWRNKKMTIILVLVGILGVYILLVVCCGGFALKGCF